MQLVNLLFS